MESSHDGVPADTSRSHGLCPLPPVWWERGSDRLQWLYHQVCVLHLCLHGVCIPARHPHTKVTHIHSTHPLYSNVCLYSRGLQSEVIVACLARGNWINWLVDLRDMVRWRGCFEVRLSSICRVWDVSNGQMLNTLVHHCEAVLHLRFNNNTMVTCSKVSTLSLSLSLSSSSSPQLPNNMVSLSVHCAPHTLRIVQ